MKIAIVIPARYSSTRFPGKPLAMIGGKTMLQRVAEVAKKAAGSAKNISIFITTEDIRIEQHAKKIGIDCIMTSKNAATGSDRVLEAVKKSGKKFDYIINLQGDAPFTPPEVIKQIIKAFNKKPQVVTPVHRLSWKELDALRKSKKTTPLSGTTAIINGQNRALWFSKNIIPAIRDEESQRKKNALSPVYQHIGLYGFRADILEKFCKLPPSPYEKLESLEQLRLLENGIEIRAVPVKIKHVHSGIDAPEDLKRAEKLLKKD